LTQSDPTDHVLATIAGILDQPETQREPEKAAVEEKPAVAETPVVPEQVEAEGYSKIGPGPMEALRFKWTVRREGDEFFVDETIGHNSAPVVSGPMTKEAAIKHVDASDSEARRRFDLLKSEMSGERGGTGFAGKDSREK
jgi:hypothetical protein